jgi:hypothetical protein
MHLTLFVIMINGLPEKIAPGARCLAALEQDMKPGNTQPP